MGSTASPTELPATGALAITLVCEVARELVYGLVDDRDAVAIPIRRE